MPSLLDRAKSAFSFAAPELVNAATKVAGKAVAGTSVAAFMPTGSVVTDPDGVRRYVLSDEDVRKLKGAVSGVLRDSTGKPSFRVSRVDEAVVPAVLARFGLPLGLGLLGVFMVGRLSAPKGAR